ncbi:MlaE family ABC transporter permease [Wenzhouxiangella limi]|nr:ABC transporter permease [Wenzhouxiangella limi]
MKASSQWLLEIHKPGRTLRLGGDWRIDHAAALQRTLDDCSEDFSGLDGTDIAALDAAGAFLLLEFARRCGVDAEAIKLEARQRELLFAVARSQEIEEPGADSDGPLWRRGLARLGGAVLALKVNTFRLLGFLGLALATLAATVLRPGRWRVTATVHHMQQSGLDALPLVSLLSFLVGAVIAFLGATVLRDFGAELFVVDLTTYAFLREFGVLLTAILLAGRTASAFAAQIGTMKSREEIDAIRTLGQDPIVLLVLPRLLALLIMLPLLSVVATLAGLLGGLTVAVFNLGIPTDLFISRVQETATLSHYLTGLSKAPIFAMVIALVGCLEGFKVAGTAQSVGERTTSAVVQSISLVIIIDALAAVFFMEMGW